MNIIDQTAWWTCPSFGFWEANTVGGAYPGRRRCVPYVGYKGYFLGISIVCILTFPNVKIMTGREPVRHKKEQKGLVFGRSLSLSTTFFQTQPWLLWENIETSCALTGASLDHAIG